MINWFNVLIVITSACVVQCKIYHQLYNAIKYVLLIKRKLTAKDYVDGNWQILQITFLDCKLGKDGEVFFCYTIKKNFSKFDFLVSCLKTSWKVPNSIHSTFIETRIKFIRGWRFRTSIENFGNNCTKMGIVISGEKPVNIESLKKGKKKIISENWGRGMRSIVYLNTS